MATWCQPAQGARIVLPRPVEPRAIRQRQGNIDSMTNLRKAIRSSWLIGYIAILGIEPNLITKEML
jgi:hypothetical protein